ncbi:MAG TPA: NAD-binding protein [Pseudomonadales bacterium]|nr:NAD-binding protein [Pseudomonadales bacterium]
MRLVNLGPADAFGLRLPRLGWRARTAVLLFAIALLAFGSGVGVSQRPAAADAGLLEHAYMALGLFVVGGLDLGTPVGGSLVARAALWVTYFAAPLLFASAVFEAVVRVLAPELWILRRLRGHLVVVGVGSLTSSYLRQFRQRHPRVPVVVVDEGIAPIREQELEQTFGVHVVHGKADHEFLLRALRLDRARRVALLGDDSFEAFEAAGRILKLHPDIAGRVLLNCGNLRFMRAMQDTAVARTCTVFNAYHLAAAALVRDSLLAHFHMTRGMDLVVLAGFGRFGQSILEELDRTAGHEIDTVVAIDTDAERRMQVVSEQGQIGLHARQIILQGDIGHPQVWRDLASHVDLGKGQPVLIVGTGRPAENLRTALWLRRQYPDALILTRTNSESAFATSVGAEHRIQSISIDSLVESNLPPAWLD